MIETLTNQALANSERWFPDLHRRSGYEVVVHMSLGLAGEVGEYVNLVKKANRLLNLGQSFEALQQQEVVEELADCLVYLLNIAGLLGVDLEAEFQRKQAICETRWGHK